MARQNPVSPRDIEIGQRLKAAREEKLISRTALAGKLGIPNERLFKYETGLVPLQFWPGLEACSVLNLNQTWLATGLGNREPFIKLDHHKVTGWPDRVSFQTGYDEFLRERLAMPALRSNVPDEPLTLTAQQSLEVLVSMCSMRLPPEKQSEFFQRLTVSCVEIAKELGAEIRLPK